MNQYILLYKHNRDPGWTIAEGEATTEVEFLENEIGQRVLQECEWTVYEVARATHKDEYIHSGEIDHLLEE